VRSQSCHLEQLPLGLYSFGFVLFLSGGSNLNAKKGTRQPAYYASHGA
jgi:hypothetical protein